MKLSEINNSQEYDQYVLSHVKSYMVTELVDRAKYKKTPFDSIEKAKEFYYKLKSKNPIARIGVYAVCYPPHTKMCVNQIVSV